MSRNPPFGVRVAKSRWGDAGERVPPHPLYNLRTARMYLTQVLNEMQLKQLAVSFVKT